MTKESIVSSIETLHDSILSEQDAKKGLIDKFINSDADFRRKFQIWYNYADHDTYSMLPRGDIRAYFDDYLTDMRGVLNVLDGEDFELFGTLEEWGNSKQDSHAMKNLKLLEVDKRFLACCQQLMTENIVSFGIDW